MHFPHISSRGLTGACVTAALSGAASMAALAGPNPSGAELGIHFGLADTPYTLASACDLTLPFVFVNVKVHNVGKTALVGQVISATDDGGVLTGDGPLPPLASGERVHLAIPLRHVSTSAAPIGGAHLITLALGGETLANVPVMVPPTLCGTVAGPAPSPKAGESMTVSNRPRFAVPVPAGESKSITANPRADLGAVFRPAVPSNLRSAAGGPDCAGHVGLIGALVCPDMIKSGDLLLVWDGPAPADSSGIDGYRVYRMNGLAKVPTVVGTRTKDLTLFDVPKPAGGYTGQCYAVKSFAGAQESGYSGQFCAGAGSAATTTTYSASHLRWSSESRGKTSPSFHNVFHAGPDDGFQVGFAYFEDAHTFGDASSAVYYRAAMAFDVSALSNRRLISAKLRMNIASSMGSGNNHSCATDVGTGTEFWWQNADWIDGQFGSGIAPTDTGPVISADVTSIVAPWLRGEPNYGFVVRNSDENLDAFTNKECITRYATNPVLEITYY
jgi:hypothetical protein